MQNNWNLFETVSKIWNRLETVSKPLKTKNTTQQIKLLRNRFETFSENSNHFENEPVLKAFHNFEIVLKPCRKCWKQIKPLRFVLKAFHKKNENFMKPFPNDWYRLETDSKKSKTHLKPPWHRFTKVETAVNPFEKNDNDWNRFETETVFVPFHNSWNR